MGKRVSKNVANQIRAMALIARPQLPKDDPRTERNALIGYLQRAAGPIGSLLSGTNKAPLEQTQLDMLNSMQKFGQLPLEQRQAAPPWIDQYAPNQAAQVRALLQNLPQKASWDPQIYENLKRERFVRMNGMPTGNQNYAV